MHILLRAVRTLNNVLERIVGLLAGLLMAFMVVIVFGGALTRHMTGTGYNIVMELPPMLMPWLIFPLAGVLIRTGAHIAVDFLPDRLSPTGTRWLRALIAALTLGAAIVFTIAGYEATELFMMVGQRTEMEWSFPIWWIYLSFPVGFAIMASFALEILVAALAGIDPRERNGVEG